jgi:phospho-N-acetylmuramoyl-pentapeptide-transferase
MDAIQTAATQDEIVIILLLGFLGLVVAMLLTPIYTTLAYKYKFWKKIRKESLTGDKSTIFTKLHKKKHARKLPTMAGVITILSIVIVTVSLNWSRSQTWLPVAALLGAGGVGLLDDVINLRGSNGVTGLRARLKLLMITTVALLGGIYFYSKLGYDGFHFTFFNDIYLGALLIPLFVFVVVSTANAVNITDGLDGLAGGLLTSAFTAYGLIALLQGNFGIAGFCLTIVGALLSYVWFNIYPARFIMGDVGSFALGTALGVIAMLTDTLILLPIIGFVFVMEAGSSVLQVLSKKLRGKKLFKVAPIHHHFEAMGWPEAKVTMRFWVIGQVSAVLGVILALLGGHI